VIVAECYAADLVGIVAAIIPGAIVANAFLNGEAAP
jgi:hypothetical protein